MSTIVRFNRKFTQEQLSAAEGYSSINNTAVVDGTWYIAKTDATKLYVGSKEDGEVATLKVFADISGGSISTLDATITGTASGGTNAATTRTDSVQVVGGITIKEQDGKLVAFQTNGSSITAVKADMAGAADKAYDDAVAAAGTYTDNKVSQAIQGLGTIMHFKGTKSNEAQIKALASAKAGDVWINSADGSEWVCTADISAADETKWEKFGTTDVSNALYKDNNAFTDGYLLLADGTSGKVKASAIATVMSNYKTKQTAYTDSGYAATKYVSKVTQNENGEITVTHADLPSGSGSAGSSSSAADAWKTVVHDVSLSGHSLSGNTKNIPAASAGTTASNGTDGYMTAAQAYNLAVAVSCLLWDE
jgi:hypothetical protein